MRYLLLLVGAAFVAAPVDAQQQHDLVLRYESPAPRWEEALPVGNGRLGAMVMGTVGEERLVLNEETLWTGGPYDPSREGGAEALPEIRRLLFAGDVEQAHDLFGRSMMGIPYEQQKYQPLGDLRLTFPGHDDVSEYRRELDLDAAEVRVSYVVDGTRFTRTVFSSHPDRVLVVRVEADRPGAVSFDARLFGMRNTAHSNYDTGYFQMDGRAPNQLRLTGKNSDYLGVEGTLTYEARLVAKAEGGSAAIDYRTLKVRDADAVTLVIAGATSFEDYRSTSADPAARVESALEGVADVPYSTLRTRHLEDHRALFRRVSLSLGSKDRSDVPFDRRLAELDSIPDPSVAALAYQFGRYLMIASSREGTQPANLQGIWNDRANPSWDSKYTVNINLPMNYWPAESAGLPELAKPLFGLIRDVSEAGQPVAEKHWGAPGWVLHQNTDIWRATAPMDGPSWGAWPVGGAWLVTHLFEHDRFSPDDAFVAEWYPIVSDQVRFLADILVEHPEHGWLVTAPSNSPENFPAYPGNGRYFDETSGLFLRGRMMQPGPTMDNQIVRAVFDGFIEWSERLGRDAELREEIRTKRDRLPPNLIGRHGQLQEWLEDWDELEPEHRHVSHLWGAYPGAEISDRTPELAEATAVSLVRRGTGGCGWSYSHKIGAWARIHRADGAQHEVQRYLADNVLSNLFSRCGRTLQVDGSFGTTAAIGEMLLQSDNGVVELLPALPESWSEGSAKGLRARGGFVIDFSWADGRIQEVQVLSEHGRPLSMTGMEVIAAQVRGEPAAFRSRGGLTRLPTKPGFLYVLTAQN